MVLYFLVTGELAFDDKSDSKIIELTLKNSLPFKKSHFGNLDPELPDLLRSMTSKDPGTRPSVSSCLSHPFFSSVLDPNV